MHLAVSSSTVCFTFTHEASHTVKSQPCKATAHQSISCNFSLTGQFVWSYSGLRQVPISDPRNLVKMVHCKRGN